jgi:hypothetical protein
MASFLKKKKKKEKGNGKASDPIISKLELLLALKKKKTPS